MPCLTRVFPSQLFSSILALVSLLAFLYFLFCLSLGSMRRRFELKTCFFAIDFAGGLKFSQNERLFRCEVRHSLLTRDGIVTVPTLFVMMATHINPTLSHQSKASPSEHSTLQCRLPICPHLSSVLRSHRRFRCQSHHMTTSP